MRQALPLSLRDLPPLQSLDLLGSRMYCLTTAQPASRSRTGRQQAIRKMRSRLVGNSGSSLFRRQPSQAPKRLSGQRPILRKALWRVQASGNSAACASARLTLSDGSVLHITEVQSMQEKGPCSRKPASAHVVLCKQARMSVGSSPNSDLCLQTPQGVVGTDSCTCL